MSRLRAGDAGAVRLRWLVFMAVLALIAALVPGAPSGAEHDGNQVTSVFESNDGNLDPSHVLDWNSFTTNALAAQWNFSATANTDAVGNPDDIYSGGVKQDHECPGTKQGSLGGGNSKFDLKRIYVGFSDTADGDVLILGWVRVPQNSTTASSHVAYEFNQGTNGPCDESDPDSLLKRSIDDRLIVYDFEGGQADPSLKLLTWTSNAAACEVANTAPCWGDAKLLTDVPTVANGKVNTSGPVNDHLQPSGVETLQRVEFGEAAINLSRIPGGGVNPCFFSGDVTGVSRSSGNSGTAQMKDKVGPDSFNIPQCASPIITTKVRISDSATITPFDASGTGTGTLTFRLYGPNDGTCAANPVFTSGPYTVTSAGTIEATNFYEVPLNATGTYRWTVEYTGDSNNLPASTGCQTELVTINYGF